MVRSIFAQPDADTVSEQHARVVAQLEERFPEAAGLLAESAPDHSSASSPTDPRSFAWW